MDEAFESLKLTQTGKSHIRPVVFLEAPESGYWICCRSFVDEYLVNRQMICPEDCNLFCVADNIEEAVAEIEGFYRNYQSQRSFTACWSCVSVDFSQRKRLKG